MWWPYTFSSPTSWAISILLPSIVHMSKAPLRQNFILLVPLASFPTVLMCSLTSVAGIIISARRHVVVGNKYNLKLVSNWKVIVDDSTHFHYQVDDWFGHCVCRSCLSGKDLHHFNLWFEFFWWHWFQLEILPYTTMGEWKTWVLLEDIQKLAFVFMNPFHLGIKDCI